ncbi:MAG TPA: DUF3147 family protein [Polyangia bacterium]|nr:DUF3147 family protein [Polyangia bacterium]
MTPKLDCAGLGKPKPWEYLIRFIFGGAVTVAAMLITKRFGPTIGGLFLGFPAILPASLTLIKEHDGRQQAVEDARGGRLGSIGLIVFALVVWTSAWAWPPAVVLVTATVAWAAVNLALWAIRNRGSAAS